MSHENRAPNLDRFDNGIIRRKVRQIIGRAGFTRQDFEDLEQELRLRLLESMKSFQPQRAHRNAFVTAVVERDVANILRDKMAQKRDYRRITSLNVTVKVTNAGPVELAGTVGELEYNRRRCRHPRTDLELVELALDVNEVTEELTAEERALAERLKLRSKSAAARDLAIPPSTLKDAVRRMRKCLRAKNLQDYL